MPTQKPIPCLTYRTSGKCRFVKEPESSAEVVEYKTTSGETYSFPVKEFLELFHLDSPKQSDGWFDTGALIVAREESQNENNMILFNRHNISIMSIAKEDFQRIFELE